MNTNDGKRMIPKVILAIMGATLVLGCVQTTNVSAPSVVSAGDAFTVVVTSEATDTGGVDYAWLAIMVPNGWEVVWGLYSGPGFSGVLSPALPDTAVVIVDALEEALPSPPWSFWSVLTTDGPVDGEYGSVWSSTALIQTDELEGPVVLQLFSGVVDDGVFFDEPAFPCSLTVLPLALSQETWGRIKAGFGVD